MKKIGVLLIVSALALTVSSCNKEKAEEPGNVLILTDIPQRLLNAVSSDDGDGNTQYAIRALLYERVEKELVSAIYGVVDTYDAENKEFHFNLCEGEDAAWRGRGDYYVAVKFREVENDQTFSYSHNPVKDAYIMGYTERYWADIEEIKFNKVSFDQQTTTVSFQRFDNAFYGVYE